MRYWPLGATHMKPVIQKPDSAILQVAAVSQLPRMHRLHATTVGLLAGNPRSSGLLSTLPVCLAWPGAAEPIHSNAGSLSIPVPSPPTRLH